MTDTDTTPNTDTDPAEPGLNPAALRDAGLLTDPGADADRAARRALNLDRLGYWKGALEQPWIPAATWPELTDLEAARRRILAARAAAEEKRRQLPSDHADDRAHERATTAALLAGEEPPAAPDMAARAARTDAALRAARGFDEALAEVARQVVAVVVEHEHRWLAGLTLEADAAHRRRAAAQRELAAADTAVRRVTRLTEWLDMAAVGYLAGVHAANPDHPEPHVTTPTNLTPPGSAPGEQLDDGPDPGREPER